MTKSSVDERGTFKKWLNLAHYNRVVHESSSLFEILEEDFKFSFYLK
jgi:hypothetical protein